MAAAAAAAQEGHIADNMITNSRDHGRSQSKRWMITVFSDTWVPTFTPNMAFATWQRERCPHTGRIHVHVYVRFVGRMRFGQVKNAFARQDMHLEPCHGNEQECTAYVEKEESRIEAGARHGVYEAGEGTQGRRTDLEAIASECAAGRSLVEIATAHPGDYIRYHSGITALHAKVAAKPPVMREVVTQTMYGPTAVGKTHRVLTEFPDAFCVVPGRGPFDMYNGEDVVFFDEFDWTQWTIHEMNRFLDKYRLILNCRYANRYAAWTRVVICANSCPLTWWPNADLPIVQAFRRRISGHVYHVTSREQRIEEIEPEVY